MSLNIVGKSVPRADAREKVTGTALYIDDLRFPRTLYLKVLRAGIPHAKIKNIETKEAESIPGVLKILTGKTIGIDPEHFYGTCIFDQLPIAFNKVRHSGEIVAAVIAESEKTALAAVEKIEVDYEELPFVLDPVDSIAEGAPLIHEKNGEYKHLPTFTPVPNSNIFFGYNLKKGNYDRVFDGADIYVEGEFEYPLVNHVAMEPHGAIAHWDLAGNLHLWSSTQAPFVVREVLAGYLNLTMNKINIHVPSGGLGGGFGGKSDYNIEPLVALCARFVPNYYLKFQLTREEVFIGTVLGRGLKGYMKIGAKKNGAFVGIECSQYYADGAYADTSCNVVLAGGHNCTGPYFFPNCNLKSFGVYTNTVPVGAMRGYGHPEGQFMVERLIENLALKLGIDSRKLRMKNFLKPGDTNSLNQPIFEHNGNVRECFQRVVDSLNETPLPGSNATHYYGRGFAALVKSPVQTANASSNVFLKVNEDLTVSISIGGVEMGQGALTVLAQLAAEKLQFSLDKIRINPEINTQITPWEWQTVASMTTMRVGNAILIACERAIEQFKVNASFHFQCDISQLNYNGKAINYKDKEFPLEKLVLGYQYPDGHTEGNPIQAVGSSVVRNVTLPDSRTGQYHPYEWTFGAQGCDVSIEKSTGIIKVLHFVTALDVGKVINPATAKGQIYGGVMMGLGHTLMEKIEYDTKGRMKTVNLRRYRIPKLSDMPEKFSCIFVETPQPDGPYGARPIAEHSAVAPPAAILNAIQNATGISFTKIPITSSVMVEALSRRK